MDRQPSEQDLYYHAADCLDTAYRELGSAADDLRGFAGTEFMRAVAEAKRAINRAKDEIGA